MSADPLVVFKSKLDARAPAAAPDRPPMEPRRRKPLGLEPAPGDDDVAGLSNASPGSGPGAEFDRSVHPIVVTALAGISQTARQAPATVENTFTVLDVALQADDELRSHIVALRDQVSELKAALIEARHEVRELKLIQESLRISTRGESGRDGARGVPGRDGRDGPPGPRGEKGDQGERGRAAPRISAWEAHPERFTITPVYSTGEKGAPINLLGLFRAYDNAVQELEDRDLASAAADSRQAAEDAAEASRWATR